MGSGGRSIFFLAFALATWHAFPMIQLTTRRTAERLFQLERKNLHRVLTHRTDKTSLLLTDLTPIEMFTQYIVIALKFARFLPVIDIIEIFHTE